ncbi:MAG TPA: DinB family protein [Bryobacteraceae bacterium]|nr:DinB family protein [Bryobacteraceae bacterium]
MSESVRIQRALETAFAGPSWHGPSLMENLAGVSEQSARSKPVAGAHSIWEIVNHLAAWQKFTIAVMDGAPYATLQGEADWPPVGGTWENSLATLRETHRTLSGRIRDFSEEKLRENVPEADYSWRVLLRGIASHSLYHAGQIGLLKRACAA